MSATNSTPVAPGVAAINTPVELSKEEAVQEMAAEDEARRVEDVATHKRELELAKKNAKEELLAKGKNAVLKHQPSRPLRRPAKKNRKPLPPPSNKEHATRNAVEQTTAGIQQKQLASLRIVRPSYSYSNIVEQRMVNGITERIPQLSNVLQTASSVVAYASDPATEFDTESSTVSEENVPQLVRELSSPAQIVELEDDVVFAEATDVIASPHVYVDIPMVDMAGETSILESELEAVKQSSEQVQETVFEEMPCSPLAILSMPNAALYPPRLSRDEEAALVAMHVASVTLPVTTPKQQKTSKADRKTSVGVKTDDSQFVASLLFKPNGQGETKEARDLHNNLVDMHVTPLEFTISNQQQKKAKKAKKSPKTALTKPVAVDTPTTNEEPIVSEEPNTDEPTHEEPSIIVTTPIDKTSEPIPSPSIETEDKPHHIDAHTQVTSHQQTIVIPSESTTNTSPFSDRNASSPSPSTPNSSKTSRLSSPHSSATIRRKADKARTTFLGATSLETFINTLAFELHDGTTTKDDICEAFAILAGCQPSTADLHAVRIQRKIKLGNTSLYGFLRQLAFDDDDVTGVGEVMKVFRKAAKNDVASHKLEVALWLAETSQDEGGRRGRRSERSSLADEA
jgi:hypothetical protein